MVCALGGMKKIFFHSLFLMLLISVYSPAQTKPKDWYLVDHVNYKALSPDDKESLETILPLYHKATVDTVKLAYLHQLVEGLNNETLWPKYNELMLKLSENKPEKVYLKYYAAALNNVGFVADNKGNVSLAINLYTKSLKIREDIGDLQGTEESLHNIGNFYNTRGDIDKALDYFLQALEAEKKMGDKTTIPVTLGGIGTIYLQQKKFDKAMDYFNQSLKIAQESGNKKLIAGSYTTLGSAYKSFGDDKKALACYETSVTNAKEAGDKDRLSNAYIGISTIYLNQNENALAEKYAQMARQLGLELGYPKTLRNATHLLYKIYKSENKSTDALTMYEFYIQMRDSINNSEQTKMLASLDYDAKEAEMEIQNEKQAAIAATENKRQKTVIYSVSGILVLVFFSALVVFRSYNQKKKAHVLITKQKEEVEHSRKELIDSINYAKLIQEAIFKEEEHISDHLPSHFVLFKPKDIVSGDFHWALEKGDFFYVTAADCTGHGVPGAFLTMLGISFLNEINAKEEILTPAEILNQLRDKLVKELGRQGQTKDGMDISLIRINLKTKELVWAGAYNPLWYITQGVLHEIKADKQPIGYSEKPLPFTDHELKLNVNDSIYLFTDGYADQFGGQKGKKFKYKQLGDLLLANYNLTMEEQKEILNKQFETWKGNLEQVDDVTIVGIKL